MSWCDRVAPGIAKLIPYQPGKPIEVLERELGIDQAIKLASNENPFGPSPKAIIAAKQRINQVALYPDGNGFSLRCAIADCHGVDKDCITLGNGSNEILELVARLFLAKNTQAIFPEHAFAVYPIVTQAAGAKSLVVAVKQPGYEPDLQAMIARITDQVRVIFLANPNNPTGTWIDEAQLYQFITKVPKQVIIVLDEAYFEYVDHSEYGSGVQWIEQFPNLLITRTFSKVYGLAGLRIGYGVSQPELAQWLNRARQPFNTNSLAQAAALAALDDVTHVEMSRDKNRFGLEQLEHILGSMGLSWIPSAANFISVDFGRDAQPIYQALLREGIIVRPLASYHLPKHLRVTIGSEAQNQRLAKALQGIL